MNKYLAVLAVAVATATAGQAMAQGMANVKGSAYIAPTLSNFEHRINLPLQDLHGAMNLCAHVVQQAVKIGHVHADEVNSHMALCAQGRFDDLHRLVAPPEPVWMHTNPISGEHAILPHWAVPLMGVPESAKIFGQGAK